VKYNECYSESSARVEAPLADGAGAGFICCTYCDFQPRHK